MPVINIIENLLFSVLVSSLIGWNRESKSSPAGLRTYNLVCLGAVIITIVSKELSDSAIQVVIENPDLKGVVRADSSKIIAQIVSGIGFLGAGTIIVTKQKIKGLSTASSLWVTAAIGIAVGLEYYALAALSSILVVIILALFNKITPSRTLKKVSIIFKDEDTEKYIVQYFNQNNIEIIKIYTKVFSMENGKRINNIYSIKQNKSFDIHQHILFLGQNSKILEIELLDV